MNDLPSGRGPAEWTAEMQDAALLARSVQWAFEQQMGVEFLREVIAELKSGGTVGNAVWRGNCEWDL